MSQSKKALAAAFFAGALLASGGEAASAPHLLPGEIVIDQKTADVTGDRREDMVYLIGKPQAGGAADAINAVVIDGANGEISRSTFGDAAGYQGKLFIGDFNGDRVNDVMFAVESDAREIFAYAVGFRGETPTVIFDSGSASDVKSGEIVLTKDDIGKTIKVKAASRIQLRLTDQPGAGYAWQFDAFDAKVFDYAGRQSFVPVAGPGLAGKPQLAVFTINAARPGTAKLALSNYRPWEGPGSAIDHFSITIEVI